MNIFKLKVLSSNKFSYAIMTAQPCKHSYCHQLFPNMLYVQPRIELLIYSIMMWDQCHTSWAIITVVNLSKISVWLYLIKYTIWLSTNCTINCSFQEIFEYLFDYVLYYMPYILSISCRRFVCGWWYYMPNALSISCRRCVCGWWPVRSVRWSCVSMTTWWSASPGRPSPHTPASPRPQA